MYNELIFNTSLFNSLPNTQPAITTVPLYLAQTNETVLELSSDPSVITLDSDQQAINLG